MIQPRVSVVIPAYNAASVLPRALDSVCAQSTNEWELIVVDDGSTDATPAVLADYSRRLGSRMRVVRQTNRGASAARNAGIDIAEGEFVAFHDADDEMQPTKLERQLALFDLRPELDLVYSDYALHDLEGVVHPSAIETFLPQGGRVEMQKVAPGLHACDENFFDVLLGGYFVATIVGMVRRAVLGHTIRFAEQVRYAEEWVFYLEVSRGRRVGYVEEALSVHHCQAGSLSRTSSVDNIRQLLVTLHAIRERLPDLRPYQRAIWRKHAQHAHLQRSYDLARAGRYAAALYHRAAAWWEARLSTGSEAREVSTSPVGGPLQHRQSQIEREPAIADGADQNLSDVAPTSQSTTAARRSGTETLQEVSPT
jgi:hypothetical protein